MFHKETLIYKIKLQKVNLNYILQIRGFVGKLPFLLCLSVVLSNFFTAHIKRTKHASFAPKDAFVEATL
jgi:hypothetical protein